MIWVHKVQILKADSKSYEPCELDPFILTQLLYSCMFHGSRASHCLKFEEIKRENSSEANDRNTH